MLQLVAMEYPHLKNNEEIAKIISNRFNIICTEKDILGYHQELIITEDYELENRKQEYEINY